MSVALKSNEHLFMVRVIQLKKWMPKVTKHWPNISIYQYTNRSIELTENVEGFESQNDYPDSDVDDVHIQIHHANSIFVDKISINRLNRSSQDNSNAVNVSSDQNNYIDHKFRAKFGVEQQSSKPTLQLNILEWFVSSYSHLNFILDTIIFRCWWMKNK